MKPLTIMFCKWVMYIIRFLITEKYKLCNKVYETSYALHR